MKVRHFNLEDGKLFVDDYGDFLHINDIKLILKEKRPDRRGRIQVFQPGNQKRNQTVHKQKQK